MARNQAEVGAQGNPADAAGSVQAQLEANARAREILNMSQWASDTAAARMKQNDKKRQELRNRINTIVGRQERGSAGNVMSSAGGGYGMMGSVAGGAVNGGMAMNASGMASSGVVGGAGGTMYRNMGGASGAGNVMYGNVTSANSINNVTYGNMSNAGVMMGTGVANGMVNYNAMGGNMANNVAYGAVVANGAIAGGGVAVEAKRQAKKNNRAKKASKRNKGGVSIVEEQPGMMGANLAGGGKPGAMMNKKIWLAAGGVLAAIVLVVAGVMVFGGNDEDTAGGCNGTVGLNCKPEGYGEDPADSTVAAVFDSEIREKMKSDDYTLEDALNDYKQAYSKNTGEMRISIAFYYARFMMRETGDADAAAEILNGIYKSLKDDIDITAYYLEMIDIYEQAGMSDKVSYYQGILDGIKQSQKEIIIDMNNME